MIDVRRLARWEISKPFAHRHLAKVSNIEPKYRVIIIIFVFKVYNMKLKYITHRRQI